MASSEILPAKERLHLQNDDWYTTLSSFKVNLTVTAAYQQNIKHKTKADITLLLKYFRWPPNCFHPDHDMVTDCAERRNDKAELRKIKQPEEQDEEGVSFCASYQIPPRCKVSRHRSEKCVSSDFTLLENT